MVADKQLNIHKEINSDPQLCDEIWRIAEELGHEEVFINEEKYAIFDDHLPFVNQGIPSCLIIDLDYPHWHLQSDTTENISAESIHIVGNVLHEWIKSSLP
jgi:hypothetical protein